MSDDDQVIINQLRKIILDTDQKVSEQIDDIMSQKNSIVYHQENVFKYGLSKAKNHISFHSMVMNAFPEITEIFKPKFSGVKFLKGCINIKKLANFDLVLFEEMLKLSSQKDFNVVINHYKIKK